MAPSNVPGPTIATLGTPGNRDAEPGSLQWAIAIRLEIQSLLHDTESNASFLGMYMQLMEKHQGFKHLYGTDGKPFVSFEDFCVTRPPLGLGYSRQAIDRIVKDRQEKNAQQLAENPKELRFPGALDGNKNNPIYVNNKDYNIIIELDNNTDQQGTSAEYLTARIARDRPDILSRMKAGEYKSVRQAAKDAGIIKPELRTLARPDCVVRAILKTFDKGDISTIVSLLEEAIAEPE